MALESRSVSESVRLPAYAKLDLQSQSTLSGDGGHSAVFSVEPDPEELSLGAMIARKGGGGGKQFLPLHGTARKVALPMIAFSAVGWILFVLSFGIYKNRYMYVGTIIDYPELYWAWIASIVGPVTYILALIHAVMWKRASAAIGSATALLGVVYTTTLGYALITCGIYTYNTIEYANEELSDNAVYPEYVGLMFAGSFIACLFWGPGFIVFHFLGHYACFMAVVYRWTQHKRN